MALPSTSTSSMHRSVQAHDENALWALLLEYLTSHQKLSRHTLRAYRTGFGAYLQFLEAEEHCLSHPPALQSYADWLQGKGLSGATVRSRLVVATHLLKALHRLNALSAPPPLAVTLTVATVQHTEVYTDTEVKALLDQALPEERVILLLALEGGLSTGEISALQRDQVMLDDIKPHLVVQAAQTQQQVPLSTQLEQELRTWLAATPTLTGSVTAGATQPYLDYTVKAVCQRASVSYKGLRALRVTAGARCFRETGEAQAVRQFLRLSPRAKISLYSEAVGNLRG